MTVKLVYRRYIGGLQTFGAILDGELHLLAFHEIAVTVHLDGREVDEHIRSVFPGDETISLVAVEPLDCADDTFRHFTSNSFIKYVSGDAICSIGAANKNDPGYAPGAIVFLTSNGNSLAS